MRHPTIGVVLLALLGPIASFAADGVIHNDTVWHDTAGGEI
jgi:hypothetical protein